MSRYLYRIEMATQDVDADEQAWKLMAALNEAAEGSDMQINYIVLEKDGQQKNYPRSKQEWENQQKWERKRQREQAEEKISHIKYELKKAEDALRELPEV